MHVFTETTLEHGSSFFVPCCFGAENNNIEFDFVRCPNDVVLWVVLHPCAVTWKGQQHHHLDRPNPILLMPPRCQRCTQAVARGGGGAVFWRVLAFSELWGHMGVLEMRRRKEDVTQPHNPSVGGVCCVCATPPNKSDGFVVVYRFFQMLDCILSFYISLPVPGLLLCNSIQLEDF